MVEFFSEFSLNFLWMIAFSLNDSFFSDFLKFYDFFFWEFSSIFLWFIRFFFTNFWIFLKFSSSKFRPIMEENFFIVYFFARSWLADEILLPKNGSYPQKLSSILEKVIVNSRVNNFEVNSHFWRSKNEITPKVNRRITPQNQKLS